MDYNNKYMISDFYSNKDFICILTTKKDIMNDSILEIKIGPRRTLKLKQVDISSLNLIIWSKNEQGKVFYDILNPNPLKKDDKFILNLKEFIEKTINIILNLGKLTVTNFKQYPNRFFFEVCKKGLIIRNTYWLDCNYYKIKFYLKNDVIKIGDNEITEVFYESVFGDMVKFYKILEDILNDKYFGSFLDILDTFENFTEYIQIGDTCLYFDERKNKNIKVIHFNKEIYVPTNNKNNLRIVLEVILKTKNQKDLENKFCEMKNSWVNLKVIKYLEFFYIKKI